MRKLVILAALGCSTTALCAFERSSSATGVSSMGGAATGLFGNPWSVFFNPAGVSPLTERVLSLSYLPQQFGLKELSRAAFSFVEPTSLGSFAVSGERFGFELYREVTISGSYGTEISAGVHAGVSFNYHFLTIAGYGSAGVIGCDAGLLVRLTDDLSWGATALNVNAASLGNPKERLPHVYATGVSYAPLQQAILAVDLVKDIKHPLELRIGVEYRLFDMLLLRAGSATDPSTWHGGLGIVHDLLQLDYGVSDHSDLGLTHHLSLTMNLSGLL